MSISGTPTIERPTPTQTDDRSATTDLRAILDAQRAAFQRHGAPPLAERLDDLGRLKRAIKDNAERIAAVISTDFGHRSRHETLLAEIIMVLSSLRHTKAHLAGWMKPRRVAVSAELLPASARILYQPVGVVGIISPWNYPFQLAITPLIAALAAGNRVMVKPSELTPGTAAFLAEFLAGLFAADKVATVCGGPEVGAAFSRLPFDHLFYTGSTAVGREVMKAAAENLTPVTLELGGKSPCIIGEDAALPDAVASVVGGKLMNAGQTCIAPDYVLVPAARRDEFVALAEAAVRKFYPRLAANSDYTSIVNDRHYRRIARYVEEAKAAGARVVEINPAGETLAPGQRKLAPTLVVDPADELAIMRDEIFGPVLPVKGYASLDEAIDYINRRPRPLALYYFGADRAKRDEVLRRTMSGDVSVNDTLLHFGVENLPFGGVGASGIGAYHGEFGFQTFSHRKGVFQQSRLNGAWMLRPPYRWLTNALFRILLWR